MPQKKNNSNNSEKPRNAYFLSLELENVRCFNERQLINFSDSKSNPKQWTIILGDNGTGKTTLLQTLIAISPIHIIENYGLANPLNADLYEENSPFGLQEIIEEFSTPKIAVDKNFKVTWEPLRHSTSKLVHRKDGVIYWSSLGFRITGIFSLRKELKAYNTNTANQISFEYIHFVKSGNTSNKIDDVIIKDFYFSYGASRKAGDTSLSEQNERSAYKTLFDETALLINPEEWILQADYTARRQSEFKEKRKQKLEQVKEILIKVLPDVDGIRITEKETESIPFPIVEFHTPYGWVESKDLSLGYRTSMAWIVDFASRMFDLYPESENPLAEPAVVLIDEIDLHLHPKWQRELIDYLTNLFPNTQFIVTTHSPLIVQAAAARDANIVVCRREGDHVVIDQSIEAVRNWRADQILTSDLFGLETARPKEIEPFLGERQKILSKAKLTKKDEKRLAELEDKIGFMPISEDNPEDDKAMDIIRRAAERLQSQAK